MNPSVVIRVARWRCLACVATFAGILLGCFAVTVPAHSADYYPEPYPASQYQYDSYRYAPEPYYQGTAYRPNCNPCGSNCYPCGCGRCGCTSRCVVEREYYERRYASGPRRSYRSYGYGEPGGWSGYSSPSGYEESRGPFPYGYGGVRWLSGPEPYDYPGPPRPPAAVGMTGPYYGDYR
jgi:hypothetical protein